MPIVTLKNQYQGVNAHLHSQFQSTDVLSTWTGFHSDFITYLVAALNRVLPRRYRAVSEQSLQVVIASGQSSTRVPDATVYRHHDGAPLAALAVPTATWETTIAETLAAEEPFVPAAVIYEQTLEPRHHPLLGTPVTRIELLSRANKQGGSHYSAYLKGRQEALRGGLPLVEIDLLHESASPIVGMPRYPEGGYPYHITVSDPRQPAEPGQVRDYGFGVDEPIPAVPVPLAGDDAVLADYGAVYARTFGDGRWGQQVDYEVAPPRMETYAPADQQRIVARMAAIAQAVQRGDDLEG